MDTHEIGGLWLLREMWDFPAGVPEDQRLDYRNAIMACAGAGTRLSEPEKRWVVKYGATQETVVALEARYGKEQERKRERMALVFGDDIHYSDGG